jgi:hypothetical protein
LSQVSARAGEGIYLHGALARLAALLLVREGRPGSYVLAVIVGLLDVAASSVRCHARQAGPEPPRREPLIGPQRRFLDRS